VILEHVGGRDVYGQVENFSGLAAKSSKVEEGVAGLEVDEEVYVAFVRCFAACERAEGTQMTDAVSFRGVEQYAALASQLFCLRAELTPY
jgi:hypothetical protein